MARGLLILLCGPLAAAAGTEVRIEVREGGKPAAGVRVELAYVQYGSHRSGSVAPMAGWGEDVLGGPPAAVTDAAGVAAFDLELEGRLDLGGATSLHARFFRDGLPLACRMDANGQTVGNRSSVRRRGDGFAGTVVVEPPGTATVPVVPGEWGPDWEGPFAAYGYEAPVLTRLRDGAATVALYDPFDVRIGGPRGVRQRPPSIRLFARRPADGDRPAAYQWSDAIEQVALEAGELVILQEGRTLSGRLDEAVPRPVRGGRVRAVVVTPSPIPAHVWEPGLHERPVDADGRFTVPDVPYDAWVAVTAVCEGWTSGPPPAESSAGAAEAFTFEDVVVAADAAPADRVAFLVPPESGPGGVVLPMREAATLDVRVVGADGLGVPDCEVLLSTAMGWPGRILGPSPMFPRPGGGQKDQGVRAVTDADGRAVADDVPAGAAVLAVRCRTVGPPVRPWRVIEPPKAIDARPGGRGEVEITVERP